MKTFINARSFFGAMCLGTLIALSSHSAAAQAKPRKARPLATPPPRVLTGAEIISQASDPTDTTVVADPDGAVIDQPAETEGDKPVRSARVTYDDKQRRMMLNLDILTRAEQRTESLRKQLFEMIEKENTVKVRIDQIEYEMRPEMIERTMRLAGSMKPEELRESRRRSLDAERTNLQLLLTEIQSTRQSLNSSLDKANTMVDRLRVKLERDIEESFLAD